MQCPDCGYMMGDFDTECARCKAFAARGRRAPPVADNPPAAPPPLNPAPAYRLSEPAPRPLRQAGAPAAPGGTPLTAEMLACCVCGNTDVQKVSAICRAGSWSGSIRGTAVGAGMDGAGHPVMTQGVTRGAIAASTTLAQTLAPPPRPPERRADDYAFAVGVLLICLGLFVFLLVAYSVTVAAGVACGLVTAGAGVAVMVSESRHNVMARDRSATAVPRWERAMAVWNRLFYCPRCDHVYDPADGRGVPVNQVDVLL